MAMSNAERQRKYRQRRDADHNKRQQHLKESRERYVRDRQTGRNKSIGEMTDREKRMVRKKWRNQKRKDRERKKMLTKAVQSEISPPSSPELPRPSNSSQKSMQIKRDKRKKAKCYRENEKLKIEVEMMQRRIAMYKKRLFRLQQCKRPSESPRARTKLLLRNLSKEDVKRCIFKYNVVMEQLKQKYKEKRKRDKKSITSILTGHVLRKYRLTTETHRILGINTKRLRTRCPLTKTMCKKVMCFYNRNDNSRLMAGMRQTKTRKKIKKQRRVLLHNLKVLYNKFLSEEKTKLSYSQFCRLRPFYVVFPRQSDRNTCACKICDNTQLMADSLVENKAISSSDIEQLVNHVVCDRKDQKCMYGESAVCKEKGIEVNKDVLDIEIKWFQWRTRKEKRIIKQGGKEIERDITITVKDEIVGKAEFLISGFTQQLKRYMKHIFRCTNQYHYYRQRIDNLSENECVLHVDFSENYECKYAQEVQAVHFGASKKQITLHTGVVYVNGKSPKTFCSVSESLQHNPAATWGHLQQVLINIKLEHPNLNKIEIFSDGPTTQYRQKGNFYLTSTHLTNMGFVESKWSFFESGHGKGVPDAVGGSVKRYADSKVKFGTNILSAKDFCNVLSGATKTNIYFVPENVILNEQQHLNTVALKAVSGTLHIHQIIVMNPGIIGYRNLSCECHLGKEHDGHGYKRAVVCNTGKCADENNNACQKAKDYHAAECNRQVKTNKCSADVKGNITNYEKYSCKKSKNSVTKFSAVLKNLSKCKTYVELIRKCKSLKLKNLERDDPPKVSVFTHHFEVEYDFIPDIPEDLKDQDERELFPCEVLADGNCLPSCGSVFAFGNITETDEMRVRIIYEQVMHEDVYLDDEYLGLGIKDKSLQEGLSKRFSQYSEFYVPGVCLTNDIIKDIYRREVLSITEDRSFMGIWQMFALASVLELPLYSVYPMKGNLNVRKDMNRLIIPRQTQNSDGNPVYILWTNTRGDITLEHWVPNHFVPLLPFNRKSTMPPGWNYKFKLTNTCTDMKQESENKSDKYEVKAITNEITGIGITTPCTCECMNIECNTLITTKRTSTKGNKNLIEENAVGFLNFEPDARHVNSAGNGKNAHSSVKEGVSQFSDSTDVDTDQYLGKYVLVNFNGRPYPGFVEDVEGSEVKINCMHQLGKMSKNNCFFWPRKLTDVSWYDYSDIICVIPEPIPTENSRHFRVDQSTWKMVFDKCPPTAI